jgi:hypothetical protein
MCSSIACVRLGVDDDHVGLQLGDALGQIHIRRQRGDDVVARFQQPMRRRTALSVQRSSLSSWMTVLTTTIRKLGMAGLRMGVGHDLAASKNQTSNFDMHLQIPGTMHNQKAGSGSRKPRRRKSA